MEAKIRIVPCSQFRELCLNAWRSMEMTVRINTFGVGRIVFLVSEASY